MPLVNHVAADHPAQIPRAQEPSLRPPALLRPKVDIGCSPAQWADFLRQWSRFSDGCNIPAAQMTTQAMACLSDELISTAEKAIRGIGSLAINDLLTQVKAIAVQPVAVGNLQATAHSAKQERGGQHADRASIQRPAL